jgi:penicillin-binding protein 1A
MNSDIQKMLEEYGIDYIEGMKDQDDHRVRVLSRLPPVEAAAVVVRTGTGAIAGLTGSIRYSQVNSFNRAVKSRRQISSTFKPFLYALAVEKKGYTGDSEFTDKPVRMKNRDGTDWEPGNYYPYYLGEVSFREGLVVSINTIAVQLIKILGVDAVSERAREVFRIKGNSIEDRIKGEPSLSLGSIDLTPLELAKGYLVIASLGREIFPYPIKEVKGEDGRVILDYSGKMQELSGRRIYSKKAMADIREMLKEVITEGTARSFMSGSFPFEVAGKSGSSPGDSWFAGFNSDYLLVTWAGYDRPAMSRKGKLPEFVVLPYWYNLMKKLAPESKHFRK